MKHFLLLFLSLGGVSFTLGRELRSNLDICAKGQSYWCQNITTAANCRAVKHCIQSIWEKERPIEVDRSEICQTCLDMVKQARDQLLSNETQEEIKQVLEGTCKLIPIKVVSEECMKVMDEFGPYIVDTLASEMQPQVVCSVAGLCDNERVHALEAQYNRQHGKKMDCKSCNSAVDNIGSKFNSMSPNEFLTILGKMCSKMGSYSDGCMNIAVKEHEKALSWLKEKIQPRPVCYLVGTCRQSPSLHTHSLSIVSDSESLAVSVIRPNGDLPCELCVQLVEHLRDILVSNTTEADFKLVLNGICSQMTTYKDECLNLVNQYYEIIYGFLVSELDGKALCQEIKVCPTQHTSGEVMIPLLRDDTLAAANAQPVQLPVTRYNPITYVPYHFLSEADRNDETLCSMCEFFLHFVQQEITLPSSEDKIKEVVGKVCARLPESVSSQCRAFVDTYMDEFVALLAQEIDPSLICPMIGVCPRGLVAVSIRDKADCPLCLLAFQEINTKLRNKNRTVDMINNVVDDLCIRDEFPNSLSMECVGFITRHRRAIVDMVLTEFTPQESCAYIQLCLPTQLIHPPKPANNPAGDISTNEIKQNPDVEDPNTCVLCEFVLMKVDQMLKDKKTEEEIKSIVYHVCYYMPKTVSSKCRQLITQYADLIIELLAQEMDPKQVCTAIDLCSNAQALVQGSVHKCILCEALMDALRAVLTDPDVDDDVNVQLEKACRRLPQQVVPTCNTFIMELAPQIEMALRTLPVGPLVCRRVMDCASDTQAVSRPVPLRGKCVRGSSYWCISSAHAAMCNAVEFCQKEVWKNDKPKKGDLKGRVVISY